MRPALHAGTRTRAPQCSAASTSRPSDCQQRRARGRSRRVRCQADWDDVPLFADSTSVAAPPSASATATQVPPAEALSNVDVKSGRGIDYEPLRAALKDADFLKADDIHRKKLIEVAGEAAQERGWVYFSEVKNIPVEDLQTIDALWVAASGGKFGFSVQRSLWRQADGKWSRFFQTIDWLKGENLNYRAWPAEFTYDVDKAAKGHLPLTNALRGTQLFEAILTHPAFEKEETKKFWD